MAERSLEELRHKMWRSTTFLALCLLVLGPLLVTAATTSKPNVVFILIDDTGYNDLGYNNRSEGGWQFNRLAAFASLL